MDELNSNFRMLLQTLRSQPERRSELLRLISVIPIREQQLEVLVLCLGRELLIHIRKRDLWRSFAYRVKVFAMTPDGAPSDIGHTLVSTTRDGIFGEMVSGRVCRLRIRLEQTDTRQELLRREYPLVIACDEVCATLPYLIRGVPKPVPPTPMSAAEQARLRKEQAVRVQLDTRLHGARLRRRVQEDQDFSLLDTFQQGQLLDQIDRAFDPNESNDEGSDNAD